MLQEEASLGLLPGAPWGKAEAQGETPKVRPLDKKGCFPSATLDLLGAPGPRANSSAQVGNSAPPAGPPASSVAPPAPLRLRVIFWARRSPGQAGVRGGPQAPPGELAQGPSRTAPRGRRPDPSRPGRARWPRAWESPCSPAPAGGPGNRRAGPAQVFATSPAASPRRSLSSTEALNYLVFKFQGRT